MTPVELATAVLEAAGDAFAERGLDSSVLPAATTVERSRNPDHGDYSSPIALRLAERVDLDPRDLAGAIAAKLGSVSGVKCVDVVGRGFLNVRLEPAAIGAIAGIVIARERHYGHGSSLRGEKINLEFVSADPAGPVRLGHARCAVVGDCLARILRAAGAEATCEHFTSESDPAATELGAMLRAVALGRQTSDDDCDGEYIARIAGNLVRANPGASDLPREQAIRLFREEGYRAMLAETAGSIERLRVHIDVWYSERTLHDSGAVDRALAGLRASGHLVDVDGAALLRTGDGDDRGDRVLVRPNGEKTSLAAAAAYHLSKRERGFSSVLCMLGANTPADVRRRRTLVAGIGNGSDAAPTMLTVASVTTFAAGTAAGTATGTAERTPAGVPVGVGRRPQGTLTLDELVREAGVDTVRYFLARSPVGAPLTLDAEVVTRQVPENPAFAVRFAAARCAAVSRNARAVGVRLGERYDTGLLSDEMELELLRTLGDFPGTVATAAKCREPYRIARYLEALAEVCHNFHDAHSMLPKGDEPVTASMRSRLWLNAATRIVLANGLGLLGVTASEQI
ncbi:MAG: arginine--tRNA ligase [Dactylosporangium sp.]|nr:arginine--tRNA ligase [Dactylosporangium sp.]NNJ60791.1 arginine--tRNA ligase [Dactylosporangium sp.]